MATRVPIPLHPVIFVGYRPGLDNLEAVSELAPFPKGGKRNKDEIAKWQASDDGLAARRQQLSELAFRPVFGRIEELVALDPQRDTLFELARDEDGPNVSLEFIKWLAEPGYALDSLVLVGFRIENFAEVSGAEAAMAGYKVPYAYWRQGRFSDPADRRLVNPYSQIVSSVNQADITLEALLRLSDVYAPDNWQMHLDPAVDLKIATQLALKFNLVGHFVDGDRSRLFDQQTEQLVKIKIADDDVDDAADGIDDDEPSAEEPASVAETISVE